MLRTWEGRERDPRLLSLCKFPSSRCHVVQTRLCFAPMLAASWLLAGNQFPAWHGEMELLSLAMPGLLLCRVPDWMLVCRVRPQWVMGSPCSVWGC